MGLCMILAVSMTGYAAGSGETQIAPMSFDASSSGSYTTIATTTVNLRKQRFSVT